MKLNSEKILQQKNIGAEYQGRAEHLIQPFAGVSTDSRTLQPGELFFAIGGDNFDGHSFIPQAVEKGALACMVSRSWFESNTERPQCNYLLVPDSLIGFQETAHFYRQQFKIPVIAITGSTGKTTAKEMAYQVLTEKYQVLRNVKSFNNHVGVPLTLFKLEETHEMVVVEVGTNHFGEIARLAAIAAPTHGLITNIGYSHLEFLGSLAGVARAKLELFEYMGSRGHVFYNADDATLAVTAMPRAFKVTTFGLERPASVTARIINCDRAARYTFEFQGEIIALKIPGRHNVYNALAAIALGVESGVSVPEIKAGLEKFTAVEKRMEVLNVAGITIINDAYNNNPTSATAALHTLKEISAQSGGRKIVVMGDMAELGSFTEPEHKRIGELIGRLGFSVLYTFGTRSQVMAESARTAGIPVVKHFDQKPILSGELTDLIKAGDTILVKGSRVMAMEEVVTSLVKTLTEQVER